MNLVAKPDAAATAEWPDLVNELDRWGNAGRIAAFWWRDDDAVAMTPALARLLSIAGTAPLALAVIPAAAETELAAAFGPLPQVAVLQHGWRHVNHAKAGKKSEFPPGRPPRDVAADLAAGRARLAALFGARALPVLVPPWNRFDAGFVPLLARAGIASLSVMAPRPEPLATSEAAAVDVDTDLVAWKGDRGFIGTAAALGGILAELRRRRLGVGNPAAALGILSHHLVMDDAAAEFLAQLRELIGAHRAARWADIRELRP